MIDPHTHTLARSHACTDTNAHSRTHSHTHARKHTHARTRAHTPPAHSRAHTHMHTHPRTHRPVTQKHAQAGTYPPAHTQAQTQAQKHTPLRSHTSTRTRTSTRALAHVPHEVGGGVREGRRVCVCGAVELKDLNCIHRYPSPLSESGLHRYASPDVYNDGGLSTQIEAQARAKQSKAQRIAARRGAAAALAASKARRGAPAWRGLHRYPSPRIRVGPSKGGAERRGAAARRPASRPARELSSRITRGGPSKRSAVWRPGGCTRAVEAR